MNPKRIATLRLTLSTVDLLNAASEGLDALQMPRNATTIRIMAKRLLDNIDQSLEGAHQP